MAISRAVDLAQNKEAEEEKAEIEKKLLGVAVVSVDKM